MIILCSVVVCATIARGAIYTAQAILACIYKLISNHSNVVPLKQLPIFRRNIIVYVLSMPSEQANLNNAFLIYGWYTG